MSSGSGYMSSQFLGKQQNEHLLPSFLIHSRSLCRLFQQYLLQWVHRYMHSLAFYKWLLLPIRIQWNQPYRWLHIYSRHQVWEVISWDSEFLRLSGGCQLPWMWYQCKVFTNFLPLPYFVVHRLSRMWECGSIVFTIFRYLIFECEAAPEMMMLHGAG